jgi:AcrR family transcriptional regulator
VSRSIRERILAGAAEAFGALGYGKVRVEDILAASGVSRPNFYKCYENQDAVFRELSARHHREIRARIEEATTGIEDPALQVAAVVDAFLRWRAGLGPLGRVLDLEARTPGSKIAGHRRATLRAMARLSTERMRRAGREPTDPVLLTALIAALESVADSLLLSPPVPERTLGRARNAALRIVASALAGPTDPLPMLPRAPRRR